MMYDEIAMENKKNITHTLVSVLPKSSYQGTYFFFSRYAELLKNPGSIVEDDIFFELHPNAFNKQLFHLDHSECPGFIFAETDPHKLNLWNNLSYSTVLPWTGDPSWKDSLTSSMNDPEFLDHLRIVFIYRNPLDQLISLFKHSKCYPPDKWLSAVTDGDPYAGLEEFIFDQHALDSYIKMFYTFHVTKQKYPKQILCISYEDLMMDRHANLRRIIEHLDIPYDETVFLNTLQSTSIDSIRALGLKLSAISADTFPGSRHIRNGGIGVWQDIMTPAIVKKIESKFAEFGLSLEMFHLADNLNPEFVFLEPKIKQNSRRRLK